MSVTASILTLQKSVPFLKSLIPILGVFGILLGVSSFIYSTVILLKTLVEDNRKKKISIE